MNKIEDLSVKEMSIAERKAGVALTVLEDPNALGKLELLAALAWVVDKRENPQATYDEWADKKPSVITDFLGLNEDDA